MTTDRSAALALVTGALAFYGLLLGTALLLGLASGHLTLGVHGFGLVIVGQGAWMIWAAAALWRDAGSVSSLPTDSKVA